ncbi:MAG: hypothetical protein Q7J58_17690 [Hydrogenophaga sp.]|uniref:hypothetical protein n=1 Tax=Hydrogenophaga sp. TaxID=1904254 RepID=UPI00271F1072|nr:hypothetical protein [Hydrogenophaga sp.]MDO9571186.1 hypothetical protein [Hydrogenophaga sp.]MDP3375954.1 hypothetical protein [Hydrogenophaga sp.]
MGATFNPTLAGNAVANALSPVGLTGYNASYAQLFSGARPADPTITSGITALSAVKTLPVGTWLVASNGVAALAAPVGFTATATGTVSFVRFYYGSGTGPFLDVDVGLLASGEKAIVSTLSAVSGETVSLTDLRFRVATSGDTCVSPSVANEIINTWAKNISATVANGFGHLAGFSKYNLATASNDRTVTVEAWDGPIPANSTVTPAGTKLWSKSISGNELFATSGMSAALITNQTANAIASGTPTFVRATKAAYDVIPATSMQAPVSALNGVQFAKAEMVSGVSNTLTNFTVTFQA